MKSSTALVLSAIPRSRYQHTANNDKEVDESTCNGCGEGHHFHNTDLISNGNIIYHDLSLRQ